MWRGNFWWVPSYVSIPGDSGLFHLTSGLQHILYRFAFWCQYYKLACTLKCLIKYLMVRTRKQSHGQRKKFTWKVGLHFHRRTRFLCGRRMRRCEDNLTTVRHWLETSPGICQYSLHIGARACCVSHEQELGWLWWRRKAWRPAQHVLFVPYLFDKQRQLVTNYIRAKRIRTSKEYIQRSLKEDKVMGAWWVPMLQSL